MLDHFIDINDYRKLKVIGKGGYATVFRIQEKSTGKIFAAKIFKEIYERKDENEEEDEIDLTEISAEISMYLQIEHPSITPFYGFSPCDFDNEPYPCIILEYYRNGSLKEIIKNENNKQIPPKWNNTKKLINLYGIASALEYLHSKDIVYCDLKPENVLEDDNFYPKLSDFGSSLIGNNNKNKINEFLFLGEMSFFMAPEYISDDDRSKPIDVFSYSILAYQLIVQEDVYPTKSFGKIHYLINNGMTQKN